MLLSAILKWLYHSKLYNIEEKIITIQKHFRNYKNNIDSLNNWQKLKNKLSIIKKGKEIRKIVKYLKIYKSLNLIQNIIKKKSNKIILKVFIHNNKASIFIKKIKKIMRRITRNKSSNILKKYFNIWKNNINKEIERADKLNNLLYVIEKRMYINNAKYISNVSIVKIIVDVILKIRKSYYLNKLKLFAKRNKNINNLSKDLSLAKKDLQIKKNKNLISKILKYFIYQKLLKLFDIISRKQSKDIKEYKILFISNLKKKVELDNSSLSNISQSKRGLRTSKIIQKTEEVTQTKYNLTKNDQINIKEKEKEKEKDIIKGKDKIRKNIVVKGAFNKNNIINKNEEENENVKAIVRETIKKLYVNIEKILTKRIKETLFVFKERYYRERPKKEKEEEKKFYCKKLYKALKKLSIKKIFIQKEEISRAKKIIYLIKITKINSQISTDRYIRQLLRRWRFISFVKNVSKKKLELMYKNLHVGYLEIINSLFSKECQFSNMIKDFENYGKEIGMYKNADYYNNREKELYQIVKKKYISQPLEYDKENSINIESGEFINDLKYKSEEGDDNDYSFKDSNKNIIKKQRGRISNYYDFDK